MQDSNEVKNNNYFTDNFMCTKKNIKSIKQTTTMERISSIIIKYLVIATFLLFPVMHISAQKSSKKQKSLQSEVSQEITKAKIKISARYYGDSIVLRWAVDKGSAWRTLNEHGYIIERLTLDIDNNVTEEFKKITEVPVKPWTYKQWEERIDKEDDYAVIAAQSLYGESFDVTKISTNKAGQLDNMADEARMRHAFAMLSADISVQAAQGLGLRLADNDVKKGNKYIYRIYSLYPKTSFVTDTGMYVIDTKEIYNVFAPVTPKALEGEHLITLNWDKELKFSAYYIQRSADGGKTYTNLTEKPYIQISRTPENINEFNFSDSVPQNYKPFVYRIAGVTSFGDVSPWSKPIKAMGLDRTPPEAPRIIKSVVINDDNHVKITWEIDNIDKEMKGFYIGRGTNVTGPFEPLNDKVLSNTQREYIDKNPAKHKTNYYVVASSDTSKNINQSMPSYAALKDKEPPAPPTSLQGDIDTNGIVKIWWPKGTELDLNGYRVYYSNHKNDEFHALTGTFRDTTFTDTINLATLDELIYYRIVAVDLHLNNSEFSDILELHKPDKVRPVSPVFKNYNVTDTTVYFAWARSSSKDVSKQIIYRREKEKEWQAYKELDNTINEFTDNQINKEKIYEYSLVAIDDAGLASENSKPLVIRVYNPGLLKVVGDLQVKLGENGKSVVLSWNNVESSDCNYLIYRAYNGTSLQMHASADEGANEYIDKNVSSEGTYTYAIKAISKNGNKSPLSGSVKIEVKM